MSPFIFIDIYGLCLLGQNRYPTVCADQQHTHLILEPVSRDLHHKIQKAAVEGPESRLRIVQSAASMQPECK